jgi:hypothetical protein
MTLGVFRHAAAALLLAVSASAAGVAQEDAAELVERVDVERIRAIVTAAEGEVEAVVDGEVRAKIGERNVYFVPTACDGTGCRGLQVFAVYEAQPAFEDINAFNDAVGPVKLVAVDRFVVMTSYLILDHGVSFENLVEQVRVFQDIMPLLEIALYAASTDERKGAFDRSQGPVVGLTEEFATGITARALATTRPPR